MQTITEEKQVSFGGPVFFVWKDGKESQRDRPMCILGIRFFLKKAHAWLKIEAEREGTMKPSTTAYDDSFRTLLNDCRELIIPVVNEAFGESYTGTEEIIFSPNEYFLNQDGGNEEMPFVP